MTMCVNPTNATPGTFNTGYAGATTTYPTAIPSNQFTQFPTGCFSPAAPQGLNTPQWQFNPWNTAAPNPFAQPTWPGAFLPTPTLAFTPWTNTFGFNTTPWNNPWNFAQAWNPWTTPTTNGWNNPFATVQANWQTPWTPWSGTNPFNNTTGATFAPTGYTTPTTNPWAAIAATLNTLSQTSTWSPQTTYPTVTPFAGVFNTTPWSGGFPTFGATVPGYTPFATAPWTNGYPTLGTTTPTPTTPNFGWSAQSFFNTCTAPTAFTPSTYGFNPTAAFPLTTLWPMPAVFGGYNPAAQAPFNTTGFTPTTPTTPLQTTRTGIQNGDTTYRNAA